MKKKSIIILVGSILIACLLIGLLIFSCDNSNENDFKYHQENIETLSSIVPSSTAEILVKALEESCVIEQNTKLAKEDILKISYNAYEIYAGVMVRFYVENDQIKLYTFKTEYNKKDDILLYDSEQNYCKTLTAAERDDLIYTQRKHLVNNTIKITPYKGLLFHNKILNNTKIENLTFTNCSDTEISYINIIITPCISGNEYDYNESPYTYMEKLGVGKSFSVDLQKTGWTNYDTYAITQVTIMFSDGTTIVFDSFDCQFLNGDDSNGNITAPNTDATDSNQTGESSNDAPTIDDNKNSESELVEFSYSLSEDGTYYSITSYRGTASNIIIPETYNDLPVKKIGGYALSFCDNDANHNKALIEVTIPESVIEIGRYAFAGCCNLQKVVFANDSKLTTIQEGAFSCCERLESITIPKRVNYIGYKAFHDCKNLSNVYITNTVGWKNGEMIYLSSDMANSSMVARWLRGQGSFTYYSKALIRQENN